MDLTMDELQTKRNELLNDENGIDEEQLRIIDNQIAELKVAQQTEERLQKQEETIAQVDEMELPYDFNGLFDNDAANDIIRQLLKEQYQKLYDDHNAEVSKLIADYTDKLRAADDREAQLKRQNDELQNQYNSLHVQLRQAILDKEDAEDKRNNAVQQLEDAQKEIARLESHVDDLRKEAAVGAREAVKVIDASPGLDELVNKAKSFKQRSADDMIKAWEERQAAKEANGGRFVITPPTGGQADAETFPAPPQLTSSGIPNGADTGHDQPVQPEVAFQPPQLPPIPSEPGRDAVHPALEATSVGFDAASEIERLKKRIDRLERHANIIGEVA